ncbi:hypothetical protein FACS189426_02750 [Bacteroidia bacterium]|nr:hypothetical protein FACS189426_02750 [Bacteroidia bacterium]
MIAGMAISSGLSSCSEDFLDVDHYGIIEPKVLLTSQAYVEQGLAGVYDLLYPERNGADVSQGWLLKPHMALSNYPALDIQPDGWDVAYSREAWTSGQAEFDGGWVRAYQSIDRANRFLANLENVDLKILENGETTLKIIEAQARAIRAYFYTFLVQNFGGVPMLMTGDTYSTSPGKERGTASEAWTLIIEDLEYARDILEWDPWRGDKGRVTKGMAKAYLAQAYMYMANENDRAGWFGKAKKELKDIIDSGKYSLNPCFGQIHLPGVYWQPESVWEIAFPEHSAMGWGREGYTDAVWWPAQLKGAGEYGGWGPHYVSFEFCWSFEPGDKRLQYEVTQYGQYNPFVKQIAEDGATGATFAAAYGPNFGQLGIKPTRRSAFVGSDNNPNNSDAKWWRTVAGYKGREYDPVSSTQMRLAQVYLNYAEACFETGDEAEGWKYVQIIRDRAWGTYEPSAPKTMQGINQWPFPFQLNEDPSLKAPDAKTFYAGYKRSPGKISGVSKKLIGGNEEFFPVYEDQTYTTSYSYKPYTSPAWKVALLIERRHEFFAEYSLWYDICRSGMAQEYLDAEYPQNNEALVSQTISDYSFTDTYISNPHTIREFNHEKYRELYPLPFSEIMRNPALSDADQNPGY